jgi:hypothetical protein
MTPEQALHLISLSEKDSSTSDSGKVRDHIRIAREALKEKFGRGGEPGCLHEIVRRTPSGHYHCANSNCHEGFMSRNDAQVWAAKEIAALESDLGAQGVELDDLRRKCREYELE